MKSNILIGLCALTVAAFGLAASAAQSVSAGPGSNPKDVTICHRNNAVKNRYNQISVDVNAIKGDDQSSHAHHQGPVAYSETVAQQLKDQGIAWGDIIPPFRNDGTPTGYPAYNWDVVGQAVWYSGCDEPKAASASVSVEPATCDLAAKLVYGAFVNATAAPGSTPSNTFGPSNYSVTALANLDSLFYNVSPPTNQQTFTGTLADKIGYQSTDPEGECYKKPTLLVATASISTEPATCETAEKLVYGAIEHATFSGTANGTAGPGSYDVTATADANSEFAGGDTSKEFTGMLADKLPVQNNNPEGECYEAPAVATAEVSTTAATCQAAEKLVYGTINNATFSGTPNGTSGPASYDVTAIADLGAQFAGGDSSKSFTGTLADKLPAQGTNPNADCYFTPGRGAGEPTPTPTPTPEVAPVVAPAPKIAELPNTSGASTPVLVAGATIVAALVLAITSSIKLRVITRL